MGKQGKSQQASDNAQPKSDYAGNLCALSNRSDGKHSWKFDGDDPYIECFYCGELKDALNGRVIRLGRGLLALGMREITSSKYDKQWYRYTKKFNDWWFK